MLSKSRIFNFYIPSFYHTKKLENGKWRLKDCGENRDRNSRRAVRWEDLVSVYVENLPESMTTKRLRSLFSSFGQVMDVFIPASIREGRGRCFGFVRFQDRRFSHESR